MDGYLIDNYFFAVLPVTTDSCYFVVFKVNKYLFI